MPDALIALGANVGDRAATLRRALRQLDDNERIQVDRTSQLIPTRPVGGPRDQAEFLNAAATLRTELDPHALWRILHHIERQNRRRPSPRWGPRTVDLDLLLFEDRVVSSPELTVPHPRMSFRRFVLEPAAEVASHWRHPTSGRSIGELLATLNQTPHYVAMVGPGPACERLADRMQRELATPRIEIDAPSSTPRDTESRGGRRPASPIEFWAQPVAALRPEYWLQDEDLRHRVEWIATPGRSAPIPPAVSDFWLDAYVLHARDGPEPAERIRMLDEASSNLIHPKLLIVLAPSVPTPSATVAGVRSRESLVDLNELIRERGPGPRLNLANADSPESWNEVAAAIAAIE